MSLTCSQLQMTSIQEETKSDKTLESASKPKKMCFKCKTNPATLANKQDIVCKECFMEIFTHKFKSSLRKNLKIWKDDLNLIAISGGSNSMALLHLLYSSLFDNKSTRKMFFKVHIIYIDEGSVVYNWTEEKRTDNINFIKRICEKYHFTYSIVPLEAAHDIIDLDLRAVSQQEISRIEEEKKRDEEAHSEPINIELISNKVIEVDNIEKKR